MSSTIKLADVGDEEPLRPDARRFDQQSALDAVKGTVGAAADLLPSAFRRVTNRFRHLPTTVIVGAKQTGAGTLYASLLQHPRCYAAVQAEIEYFSEHAERSVSWYRSRFPLRRRIVRRDGHVLEVSPSYLPTPSALRQMKKVVPKARVIVLLRDPVARAFAHYEDAKNRRVESRSFEAAVTAELRKNAFPARPGAAMAEGAVPMLGYVSRGYYALQIELLLKVYPRNRVIFVDSDSMVENIGAACERVFDFMGLDNVDVAPIKTSDRDFTQAIVDPRVAQRLREHYRPHDEMLEKILEQSFGWMKPQLRVVAA